MKAIKNVCVEGVNAQFRKLVCIIAVLSVLTFMGWCSAEDLPVNQEVEVIIPIDGVKANEDGDGGTKKPIFTPPPPAPSK